MKYQSSPDIKEQHEKRYQENPKCDKVENFLWQIKQGPYYICTIYHRSLQIIAIFYQGQQFPMAQMRLNCKGILNAGLVHILNQLVHRLYARHFLI